MPNISYVLKTEITRLSRKEIKSSISPLQKNSSQLKKTISDLKKKISNLESEVKKLQSFHKKEENAQVPSEMPGKVRITSKTILAARKKLGLSQNQFAKLLGVSSQAVYVMENKGGKLNLRTNTMEKYQSIKGMGKREAKKILEEI